MAAKHSGGRARTTGERAAALAVLCEYRKLTKGRDGTVRRNAESVLSRPWARDLADRSPAFCTASFSAHLPILLLLLCLHCALEVGELYLSETLLMAQTKLLGS